MVFYVEDKNDQSVFPGPLVVSTLKTKLEQDAGLLELSVANIQTDICQNNCSGNKYFLIIMIIIILVFLLRVVPMCVF